MELRAEFICFAYDDLCLFCLDLQMLKPLEMALETTFSLRMWNYCSKTIKCAQRRYFKN